MGFAANFVRFPAVQKFANRLRFGKVTESLNVGTFSLRHSIISPLRCAENEGETPPRG